jgi:hypothetical protein
MTNELGMSVIKYPEALANQVDIIWIGGEDGEDMYLSFIEEGTGYRLADNRSSTDIVTLCHTVCGANLSVGYYDEHSEDERLVFSEWYHTLGVLSRLTAPPQRRFPLTETNG